MNEAVIVAKNQADDGDIVTLSTGVRARILAVGASLFDEVANMIKDPDVPKFFNEDKGRDEENPTDPEYLKALEQAQRDRIIAGVDTMIQFGVELVDGLPDDDRWLTLLQWQAKRGRLDLSEFDLEDQIDVEFLYKKFIAVSGNDIVIIGGKAGLRADDVTQAVNNFQGDKERPTDNGGRSQGDGVNGDSVRG